MNCQTIENPKYISCSILPSTLSFTWGKMFSVDFCFFMLELSWSEVPVDALHLLMTIARTEWSNSKIPTSTNLWLKDLLRSKLKLLGFWEWWTSSVLTVPYSCSQSGTQQECSTAQNYNHIYQDFALVNLGLHSLVWLRKTGVSIVHVKLYLFWVTYLLKWSSITQLRWLLRENQESKTCTNDLRGIPVG